MSDGVAVGPPGSTLDPSGRGRPRRFASTHCDVALPGARQPPRPHHVCAEVPPRVEYAVTELGESPSALMRNVAGWAAVHQHETVTTRDAFEQVRADAHNSPTGSGS